MTISVMLLELAKAFSKTLLIFFLTLLGSLPLGFLVYTCKVSRFKILRLFTNFYISVMRGTPLMLQLMAVYYVPGLLLGTTVAGNWRFTAVILAFIINYAAYFAEIYRGGMESIPQGQWQAAEILGYSKAKTFCFIILPQMIKAVLPSVSNEIITLVKDTSLSSAIGTVEMFTKAKQIAVAPASPGMLTFAAAAAFYYIFDWFTAFCLSKLEKKFAYYR